MVVESKRTRIGTAAALQARSRSGASAGGGGGGSGPNSDSHLLLARGLSARSTGSNVPLTTLTQDEMERDLRHMEAFQNACTTYAQQFYIFANQAKLHKQAQDSKKPMPVISRTPLPVRIDPEEEKRVSMLRQKIQTCEAQREVYEGQYLSLRAHYIFLSQELRDKREHVNARIAFLQECVRKRGRVVALQRVRLQVLRETLLCLLYRRNGGTPIEDTPELSGGNDIVASVTPSKNEKKDDSATDTDKGAEMKAEGEDKDAGEQKDEDGDTAMKAEDEGKTNDGDDTLADLLSVWNEIETELKKAEEDLTSSKDGTNVVNWTASKVPKIPPGVPLLLSQLADQPGQAAAWNTGGAFGCKPDSMLWIHNQVPSTAPDTEDELPSLRKQVSDLEAEIANEKELSKTHQTDVIEHRSRNDELVAMMALLRTEMESISARHNIIRDSDVGKEASARLQNLEKKSSPPPVPAKATTRSSSASDNNEDVPPVEQLKEDDVENDGDDEGGGAEEEEDDDAAASAVADGTRPKRGLEPEVSEGSTRPKRRKV
eukprot:CAMPEP_0113510702 /NCGR_PEP_ID=MMETSP0014_2-20120614/38286_1 /TAXON_ID=2857 /ORGANISM="Nitzschia sp." /LENGTH=543 /DNA_ID=CAMNT_0000406689 /DNA_START=274 /DNA_END=1905 /DNA_ORIENTATION=+ /assembly_acc=CAM_ASM_000159